MQDLMTYTNVRLQEILKKNFQHKSGTKVELMLKVADGRIHGAIPKCKKCGGGVPTFNVNKGIYWCSGYLDDIEYRMCNTKYMFQDITRTQPWIECDKNGNNETEWESQ